MLLNDYSVKDFTAALASNSPAPGGGSAAALSGALGASLLSMVCGLTVGREKYKDHEALAAGVMEKAQVLKDELTALIDEDTDAYNGVGAALAMPKDTPEQKKSRLAELQKAMKYAAEVPLRTMEKALAVIELVESVLGKTNKSAQSDLGVSSLCALSCIRGAWLNVKINLGSIKDEDFCAKLRSEAEETLKKAETIAGRVYTAVEGDM